MNETNKPHDNPFSKNTPQKFISLLLAIVLWIFVMDTENPVIQKNIKDIPIYYKNENVLEIKNLEIIDYKQDFVNITIKGRRSDILRLNKDDFKMYVDLASAEYGKCTFKITVESQIKDFTISMMSRDSLHLDFDSIVSKEFDIVKKDVGLLGQDLILKSLDTKYKKVVLKGPKRYMDTVTEVFSPLDMSSLKNSGKHSSKILFIDKNLREVSELTPSINEQVYSYELLMEKKFEVLLDVIGEYKPDIVADDPVVSPKELVLVGPVDKLSKITEIPKFVVDVSKIDENFSKKYSINLEDGIIVKGELPNISVNIEKMIFKNFRIPNTNIEFRDLSNELSAEIVNNEALDIRLYGESKRINALKSQDIKMYIMCKDIKAGNYKMTGFVIVPNSSNNVMLCEGVSDVVLPDFRIEGIVVDVKEHPAQ